MSLQLLLSEDLSINQSINQAIKKLFCKSTLQGGSKVAWAIPKLPPINSQP